VREQDRDTFLNILKSNIGFDEPERWLEFAQANNFQRVPAEHLRACPHCNSSGGDTLGQYVYYSSLMRLVRCNECDLIYSDVRLNSNTIREHFEKAYKDSAYFEISRKPVSDQVARIISAAAPENGTVLDIGGAKGHLLATLKQLRPDLACSLNDLSSESCKFATERFKLNAICGGLDQLSQINERFDVVSLVDVAYYEPEIKRLWALIAALVKPGGTVLVRIPNHLPLIQLRLGIRRLLSACATQSQTTGIPYFNPEHIFVFSRRYLRQALTAIGFDQPTFIPARPLDSLSGTVLFPVARCFAALSREQMVLTPSQIVLAHRKADH
jgi:SAM-dependent methyltransferase